MEYIEDNGDAKKEEENAYREFLIECIFSGNGVYMSCNEGSIYSKCSEMGYDPSKVSGCLLKFENELVEKGLIKNPFLKKTSTGAESRFYEPCAGVTLESARSWKRFNLRED